MAKQVILLLGVSSSTQRSLLTGEFPFRCSGRHRLMQPLCIYSRMIKSQIKFMYSPGRRPGGVPAAEFFYFYFYSYFSCLLHRSIDKRAPHCCLATATVQQVTVSSHSPVIVIVAITICKVAITKLSNRHNTQQFLVSSLLARSVYTLRKCE